MIDYSLLPLGKGESAGDRRKRIARERLKARLACVEARWAHANGVCENPACRRRCVDPRRAAWIGAFEVGHVHEVRPRSLGGDGTDPAQCVLVCGRCHWRLHRRIGPWLEVEVQDVARGTFGPMTWKEAA